MNALHFLVCCALVCFFVLANADIFSGSGSMGPSSGQAATAPNANAAAANAGGGNVTGGSFSARDSNGNASATSTELATMFACLPEVTTKATPGM